MNENKPFSKTTPCIPFPHGAVSPERFGDRAWQPPWPLATPIACRRRARATSHNKSKSLSTTLDSSPSPLFLCLIHVCRIILSALLSLASGLKRLLNHKQRRTVHAAPATDNTIRAQPRGRPSPSSCCWSMFRTKRSCLVKRLAKVSTHEAQREVEAVLKRLDTAALEALALAVETRGAEASPCVVLSLGCLGNSKRGSLTPPHVLFCRLWRWGELRAESELRALPDCRAPRGALEVCANPFHWSRLHKPDSPPPPYRRLEASDPVSPDTIVSSCLSGSSETPSTWCKVAYWELSDRVGRLLPVNQPTMNVFYELPHADGLCLQTLANSHATDKSSIIQTRTKIGQGITVFREDQEVWIYNRSEYPVFVNSPTLDPPNTENLTVHKIQPGFSIKIFDYERSRYNQQVRDTSMLRNGPFDPNAVRVSFVKGFGSEKYSRRFVTSCPCWLELMFLVNR
ncbi:hypothetical protein JTE90_011211 [Oedothorax gibbosus]|uniref:Mothers against decapentaplegic homolog n=1 Tax=Oedothorax gibbosus TaxID=931172 RepID=A0AAV6W2A7_9ARAC|nr:hypothetical protein JTE90_011211 [Oedothorax gibbosus]